MERTGFLSFLSRSRSQRFLFISKLLLVTVFLILSQLPSNKGAKNFLCMVSSVFVIVLFTQLQCWLDGTLLPWFVKLDLLTANRVEWDQFCEKFQINTHVLKQT